MNILHITDASASGVLAAVTTLARAQSAVPGADITLAYVPRPDSPSITRIRELTGPEVRVTRWSRAPRTAMPALLARMTAACVGRRDGIIHLHSSRTGMLGRVVALVTGHRGRTVYSPHCFAFDRSDAGPVRRAALIGAERAGTILAPRLLLVSDTEEQLARRCLPASRTAVLRNRVDAAALAAAAKAAKAPAAGAGRDGPGLRVVHVGRITPQKRPGEFAAIARRWSHERRRGPAEAATTFHWLGEGDRDLLGPGVEVSGWLDRTELVAELARADVLLFTTAGEGMPIAVLEAQALGVPVIAHDVTGLADVIDDGRTGLLRSDTDALARALDELERDPLRRWAMGQAAQQHVRDHFDLGGLAADSLAAYRRLGVTVDRSRPVPVVGRPVRSGTTDGRGSV